MIQVQIEARDSIISTEGGDRRNVETRGAELNHAMVRGDDDAAGDMIDMP
jgi:hypothetical protein